MGQNGKSSITPNDGEKWLIKKDGTQLGPIRGFPAVSDIANSTPKDSLSIGPIEFKIVDERAGIIKNIVFGSQKSYPERNLNADIIAIKDNIVIYELNNPYEAKLTDSGDYCIKVNDEWIKPIFGLVSIEVNEVAYEYVDGEFEETRINTIDKVTVSTKNGRRNTKMVANETVSSANREVKRPDVNGIPSLDAVRSPDSYSLSYSQMKYDEEEDLIGSGGQASVYKTTISGRDHPIALKRPMFDQTLHQEVIDRVLDEAARWNNVDDHPNIVGVIDWDSAPGPWIALEYMDGGSLANRIGDFDIPQRLWTVQMISDGVAHANKKGIAHNDIKPSNILFRQTPGELWDVPKVADWGLSRELIKTTQSVSQATPNYAAPEQFPSLMPDAPVDERTDVYQLGVVSYELLTGERPAHLSGDVPLPSKVDPELPEVFDPIIMRAITHDLEERCEHSVIFRRKFQRALEEVAPSLVRA